MFPVSGRRSRGKYPSVSAARRHLPRRGRIYGNALFKSPPRGGMFKFACPPDRQICDIGPPKAAEGYPLHIIKPTLLQNRAIPGQA